MRPNNQTAERQEVFFHFFQSKACQIVVVDWGIRFYELQLLMPVNNSPLGQGTGSQQLWRDWSKVPLLGAPVSGVPITDLGSPTIPSK